MHPPMLVHPRWCAREGHRQVQRAQFPKGRWARPFYRPSTTPQRDVGGLTVLYLFSGELAERQCGFLSAEQTLFNPAEFLGGGIAV